MTRLTKTTAEDRLAIQCELTENDRCYHIYEYTVRRGWDAETSGNSVIKNLKRSWSECQQNDNFSYFKDKERNRSARIFRANLPTELFRRTTIVPVPPSAARNDPEREFDDTLIRMANQIAGHDGDARELVFQSASTRSSHKSDGNRLTVQELLNVYQINDDLCHPAPEYIAILDDLLTKGTHYRAITSFLAARFPNAQFYGLFVAKAIPNPDDDWN